MASALFFAYVAARRVPLPRGRALAGIVLYGTLQFGAAFALIYWALIEVPAGLGSVILSTSPLFTLVFVFLARLEPLRWRGVVGALCALGGIALMFGERAGRDIPPAYLLAAVGAAACFALAPVVIKLLPGAHPAAVNAVGMLSGALVLLGLSLAMGEARALPTRMDTWVAQAFLVLPGSMGVFALLLFVLKHWSASRVSYQTVLSPLVAAGLSAWLLGEPLTSGLLLGGALVIGGVYVGALAPETRNRAQN